MRDSMKNYMTPDCHTKMSREMDQLLKIERPETTRVIAWAAGNGDRSENADYIYGKKKLREIDRRLRFLKRRLENSVVIDPLDMNSDKVQFSSTVTIVDDDGLEKIYIIVGVDEVDILKCKISWKSPIGSALLGKVIGDTIEVQAPKGKFEFEIIKIEYKEIL